MRRDNAGSQNRDMKCSPSTEVLKPWFCILLYHAFGKLASRSAISFIVHVTVTDS